jgi:NAD(P)-dependent dehydrogenase (short-subunit alcohol dehydrogenase family)
VFADYAAKSPVARVERADDVAQAVAFLITDGFITGHTIKCDGSLSPAAQRYRR